MIRTAYTALFHVPDAIPRFDKSIFSGYSGVAKDPVVISRIDAVQAAGDHKPARFSVLSDPARAADTEPRMRATVNLIVVLVNIS